MSETEREVIQADAFEALGELPDDFAHAAVVDYPWEFDYENGTNRMGYDRQKHGDEGENPMFEMAEDEALPILLGELERVLVDGAWLFCLADDRFQDVVRTSLQDAEQLVFRRNWAWTPGRMGMGYYGRVSHYPIPVATNGETERYVQDRGTLVNVDGRAESEYSTAKPLALYRKLLASPVLDDGERILEPFCGSAPGAAVASERDLSYWGCDVDAEAVELARGHLRQSRLVPDGGACNQRCVDTETERSEGSQ
ncbi:class I SAM-dependent methyltransferase [Halosimplex carlsbadense]|uniref:site-specific DNA-methyltransferase n=1 Tax=Halosimplex carlsbadense TaxID=171164 RepID=UPI001268187C|nr:site-specific DNA-methyltransferase [Halosimplex carlsbadense]